MDRFLGDLASGMPNLRDVGGYPLASGGQTRWAVLFRAGAPGMLTADGCSRFRELGLHTIIDLREQSEVDRLPTPPSSAVVHHVPLHRDRIEMADVIDLLSLYRDFLRICGDSFAAVATVLGAPEAFPALVHCSAGKDRTGLAIAIILSALGVPDAVVAQDYGRTAEVFTGAYRDRLLAESVRIGVDPQRLALMSGSPPAVMRSICTDLEQQYGGASAYLTRFGTKPEALQRLRQALTSTEVRR